MSQSFDYGQRLPDGQFEKHPTKVKAAYVAPLRASYKHLKCGGVTTMRGDGLVNTYATNPSFYGATFCASCHNYFPLRGESGPNFLWVEDGTPVGETHGEAGKDLRGREAI